MVVTPLEMLLHAVGAKDDPNSGGRQMPSHWGSPRLNIFARSSATGMQYPQAVGMAMATLYFQKFPHAAEKARLATLGQNELHPADEIVYVSGGEGSTSEGEFFEALNTACLKALPLLILIEDNGYAISVPVEFETAGGSISKLVRNYPGLHVEECDGTDPLASYAAFKRATEYCRARKGPSLVHAHVTRPYSHSLSDDERLYKTKAERSAEETRDPVLKFPEWLVSEGILDRQGLQVIVHEVDQEIQRATDLVLRADPPAKGSALRYLYSDTVDPTSTEF